MTDHDFDLAMEHGKFDDEYAAYIMDHTSIGNGDMLILAMESGVFYDGFKEWMFDHGKIN